MIISHMFEYKCSYNIQGRVVNFLYHSSSSSSILLTDIYKGWSKSQHIITDTNIVHLTGYLNT